MTSVIRCSARLEPRARSVHKRARRPKCSRRWRSPWFTSRACAATIRKGSEPCSRRRCRGGTWIWLTHVLAGDARIRFSCDFTPDGFGEPSGGGKPCYHRRRTAGCPIAPGQGSLEISQLAQRHSKPVIAFAGIIEGDLPGFDACIPIANGPLTLEESRARAAELLRAAAKRTALLLKIAL